MSSISDGHVGRRADRQLLRRATYGTIAAAGVLDLILFAQVGGLPAAPTVQDGLLSMASAFLPGAPVRAPAARPTAAPPGAIPVATSHPS